MKLGPMQTVDFSIFATAGDVTADYKTIVNDLGRMSKIQLINLCGFNASRAWSLALIGYTVKKGSVIHSGQQILKSGIHSWSRVEWTGPLIVEADGIFVSVGGLELNDEIAIKFQYRDVIEE